jgi:hypothetical protein
MTTPAYNIDPVQWLCDALSAHADVKQAHVNVNPADGSVEVHMTNGTILTVTLVGVEAEARALLDRLAAEDALLSPPAWLVDKALASEPTGE